MRKKLLALSLLVASALSAVDINKQIIGDGTFDAPYVSASQIVASFTGVTDGNPGTWYMGNSASWIPEVNVTQKCFWGAIGGTDAVYNHFLAQRTTEEITPGRYELKVDCKVDAGTPLTPFYLKLSGYNAVGTELSSKLISGNGITKTTTNSGYSITITPTGETWKTCTATLDIEVPVPATARIYFIFPNVTDVNLTNSVYVDNVSLVRIADLPKPIAAMYVRPVGDVTSWSHITPNDTVIVKNVEDLSSCELAYNYFVAQGNYKLSAGTFAPKATNGRQILITGALTGKEVPTNAAQTTLDISKRAISDLDGNGIVEPWEFTNPSILDGGSIATGTVNRMIVLQNNAIMDGFTMQNYIMAGSGPIHLGTELGSATVIPATNTPGKLVNCTVRKNQCIAGNGGGIYIAHTKSVVDKCLIEDCLVGGAGNTAGGGVYMLAGKLTNSVIRNNRSAGTGSAATCGGIAASRMAKDTATIVTATAPALASDIIIENCVVYNNTAPYSGGIRTSSTTNKKPIEVINCTFANNTTTANSNVEFSGCSAVFVNNIVTGGTSRGIRFITTTGSYYLSNYTFNQTMTGPTVVNNVLTMNNLPLYPGTGLVQEDKIIEYNFKNPSSYAGANLPTDPTFDQAKYDAMRKSNFTIVADTSLAVVNAGAATLPASFKMNGVETNPSIAIAGTIPTTDMRGAARTGNITLGAYQRLATDLPLEPSAVHNITANQYAKVSTLCKNITVKVSEVATVKVFNLNGVMLKQQLVDGTAVVALNAPQGVYIVKVNGKSGQSVQKVIVK